MPDTVILILVIVGGVILVAAGMVVIVAKFYRKVDQGKALIINKMGKDPDVTFTGGTVYPVIHRAEVMDISVKTIEIDRRGKDGLICMDNIRADIKVTFFVRVNKSKEDVLKVAQSIGCERASDQKILEALFVAKFSEALKSVGKTLEFEQLYTKRENFRDQIIRIIGKDLNGYKLEDAAIDYLEQTPVEMLDPDNILDAQGIRKITQITTEQNVFTNDLRQTERKSIKRQNVDAEKTIFDLDREQAEAEAKRDREIANIRAKETAQINLVGAEEEARATKARLKFEEEVAIENENKQREIQVAQKKRERIVGVEHERVEKDRQLEALQREQEVEVRRVLKDKAVEAEMREIADIRAERISVEKGVAEQEETIKDLRLVADAKRQKEARIITAEAEAQEKLVKDIKEAEAQEEVAKHEAKRQLTMAEAAREAADKQAQAKIRLSEGVQAEAAAEGLARVRVKEADAAATEKLGQAEARVTLEKMEAVAQGEEKQGLAKARVKVADADAVQKQGLAHAEVTKEKLRAEAAGEQEKGLAEVRIKEAEADAVEKRGLADAVAIEKKGHAQATATRERLAAEASGLAEKAEAMKALDGVGREHEEFRLQLEKDERVTLEHIKIQESIARAQAEVLSRAFDNAKINIVGGDGQFFDRFIQAVSLGKSVDGFVDNSQATQTVFRDYLQGDGSLPQDLREILSRPALTPDAIQSLTISALLGRLMVGADEPVKKKLQSLLEAARDLGLDDLTPPAK